MSDAAFRRWGRLLELAPRVPPKQRAAFDATCRAALDAAVAEAAELDDPRERVQRASGIYNAFLRIAPPEPVRSPLGSVSVDPEAAGLFMDSLFEPGPVAKALARSAGMSPELRARAIELAREGRA
jgi:hypothetical protein